MSDLYYFGGMVKWAKVRKPDQFGKYTVDLYMDDESFKLYQESPLNLKIREDEDDGTFVKLSRPDTKIFGDKTVSYGPPRVADAKGEELSSDVLIGNGSKAICKISVYPTRAGHGHRLEEIRVFDLVEYSEGEKHTPDGIAAW